MPPESSPYSTLNYPEPRSGPGLKPIEVEFPSDRAATPVGDGSAVSIDVGDGGVIIDFSPGTKPADDSKFDDNLAEIMDERELQGLGDDLLRGIAADDESRREWLAQHAEGIKYLGFIVEKTATSPGTENAPLEGMCRMRHPILAEAVVSFAASARGELLPAAGPVKVRDDRPPAPIVPFPMPPMPPQGGMLGNPPAPFPALPPPSAPPPPMGGMPGAPPTSPGGGPTPPSPPMAAPPVSPPGGLPNPAPPAQAPPPAPAGGDRRDILAQALELDFNHFLTTTAKEYYPDTDRMLFSVGYGGQGIKKVYHCPIRRRPVSESIPIENFIVSNALTDLSNASRKTHRFKMRPSVLRRMQLLGVYRDVPLQKPQENTPPNPVEQIKADVSGVVVQARDPEDADHEMYEVYCERDLNRFAPKHLRGKSLPLPYRVTIEVESKKVLEVRRNWREDDRQALAKEYFVEFPYLKGFGFYGHGLLHLLGNLAVTLTAAYRESIDSGMFSNFPGFLYAKGAGRQMTNTFRVAPGSGVGLDVGLQRIQDAIMPLPYKDLGPAFASFIQHVEELGQRLGGTANIPVSEGNQEAPVGTTLALIEQATRPIGAVLKRLHQAQQQEFLLLKDRFREDPESFWRFGCKSQMPWQRAQFLQALEDCELVPVSDPNNPTSLHRTAKAMILQQTAQMAPGLFNLREVWKRMAKKVDIEDPEQLLAPPQQGPPPDPRLQGRLAELQFKHQWQQQDLEQQTNDRQLEALREQANIADRQAERESRERVAQIQQETERLRLASTLAIHSDEKASAERMQSLKTRAEMQRTAAESSDKHVQRTFEQQQSGLDREHEHVKAAHDRAHEHIQNAHDRAHEQHQSVLDRAAEDSRAEQDRAHEIQLEQIKARARPKANGTSKAAR
jgi:hypothetical protein